MSIETKIDELIQAITANTTALNNVLAAAPAPAVTPAPAKKKAVKAEPTPAPEPAPTPETLVPDEAPAPEPAKPAISGITAADIRKYVKSVQVNYATNGMDTKKILKTVTDVREEYGASNLNDLTPEQTGPFLAKIQDLLPLKD